MAKKNMSEREIMRLKPGTSLKKYRVGDRLYIYVYPNGTKKWYFRKKNNSDILMGSFNRLSYYDAFKKRDLLYELEEKDEITVKKITVNDMFEKYYQLKSNSWSEHTRLRKRQIYEYDIQPILGKMEVKQVKIHHILKVTERIEKRDALHTLEKVVTIIKNIFLKAYQLNHISHNPALALEDLVMKPVR
ncbi:MAG: hypothetical protein PWQ25_1205 [Deferribacteres bacterium]|jgi:hypothetical protein|nr:phage integrase [Deferribacteraceae bacterium]MDK2792342.1 hypothetical protein [Deferribacteres bacterium]